MATIVTRSGKGSPLTNTEVDANFTNLNNDKFETNAQIRAAVEGASDSNVFTDADHTKLNGVAASANNYSHPTYNGDDFSVDTGALTGATVVSDIDINITTDTQGHVTDANGTVSTRTLTLANLGYTGATNANNYVHPTGNGNNHIPSNGSSGQILGYASAGTAQWQAAPSSDLVDDTSPQLGGTLQTNGNSISAVTNGDVVLVANGTGSSGFVKVKNYYGNEVFRIASGGQIGLSGANYGTSGQFLKSLGSGSGPQWASVSAIGSLVEDTSPQLGGDLDLNGNVILSSGSSGYLSFGTNGQVDSFKLSYTSAGDSEIFGNKIVAKANTSFRIINNSNQEKFKLDTANGNLTLSGTVDGRDVATDGTKLDGIETSATADQTASEIRALVEAASDSNVFTDADHTKLNGVAASANNYSHPTGNGNNHIPANGAASQVLTYASAGTAQWADPAGAKDDIFYENSQTVSSNYTLTTGKNAVSAGPITIASGVTVTVPSGAGWAVV